MKTIITLVLIFILASCGEDKQMRVTPKYIHGALDGWDTSYMVTKYVKVHDTLVYLITTDSVKKEHDNTNSFLNIISTRSECCFPQDGNRFKEGKTIDTITIQNTIYY